MSDDEIKDTPVLVWDTTNILQDHANYLRDEDPELSEDAAFQLACEDSDLIQREWEVLCDALSHIMAGLKATTWYAEVRNFGWLKSSGHREFKACTGAEMLEMVLPNTECTFKIYVRGEEIAINNAHHDSPTWDEWYSIKPVKEEEDDE